MTTRRSEDLAVLPLEVEAPLPANVRQLPLVVGLHIVLEIALRQRERVTEKAVACHARRKRQRRP